jgi:hypothetical protein
MEWQFKELKRIDSPDNTLQAVVLSGSAGATTPETTLVMIVRKGAKIDTSKPDEYETVFRADHLNGFEARWSGTRKLEIHYREALIVHFKNFLELPDEGGLTVVEARLVPANQDSAIPPGYGAR